MNAFPLVDPNNPLAKLPATQGISSSLGLTRLPVDALHAQMQQVRQLQPLPAAPDTSQTPDLTGGQTAPPQLPDAKPANVLNPNSPQARLQNDQAKLTQIEQGPAVNRIQNPVGRTLAQVGDGILNFALPGLGRVIPGTTQNNLLQQQRTIGRIGEEQGEEQKQAAVNLADAQAQYKPLQIQSGIAKNNAQIADYGAKDEHYRAQEENWDTKNTDANAWHGYKTDPQTGKLVPMAYSEMSEPQQAMEDYKHAQSEAAEAQAQLNKARNDPSSPAFRQAQERIAVAAKNAQTAVARLSLYGKSLDMRRETMDANFYGKDPNGNPLPGAPQIATDNGGTQTVGLRVGGLAGKANANVSKFNDVHGALDNVEGAAQQLVQAGGTLNSPSVVAALTHAQDPHKGWVSSAFSNWMQSKNAQSLTPAERQYVQAVAAAHENIQALRGAVGSGVSDAQINRLDSMIPGAQTPDLDYLRGQTNQIRQTANRLGQGVTTAAGGLQVRGRGNTPPPPSLGHGPAVGSIEAGYRFKGGDPSKQQNWEKVE